MPKITKYPRLRTHVRKSVSGRVRAYYFYDMRPEGKPDIALGSDHVEAIERWRELHEHKPRIRGTVQEAFTKFREETLPGYDNPRTRSHYGRQLVRLEGVFGGMLWDDVTLPLLREYLDRRVSRAKPTAGAPVPKKPVIAKTQGNREMALFSIVWGRARLWGMTALPWPGTGTKGWKHEEKPREFEVTDELFEVLWQAGDRVLRDCMDIASATGMRLTDARTVRLPQDGQLRFRASKTSKGAYFVVAESQVLADLVRRREEMKADSVMLLVTDSGEQVSERMLRTRYDDARARAMKAHPQLADQIRAMFLRDMRKRAADLAEDDAGASKLLQHSSTALTKRHYRTRGTKLVPVR